MNIPKHTTRSIFGLPLLAATLILTACSNGNDDNNTAKNYYLAPELVASGSSVRSIDAFSHGFTKTKIAADRNTKHYFGHPNSESLKGTPGYKLLVHFNGADPDPKNPACSR